MPRTNIPCDDLLYPDLLSGVGNSKMCGLTFEKVWDDLTRSLQRMDYVATLSQKIKNRIVSVTPAEVVVESERTGSERHLAKERFRPFVNGLLRHGRLDYDEDVPDSVSIGVGAVIAAILTTLPYITYRTDPIVLFLENEARPHI